MRRLPVAAWLLCAAAALVAGTAAVRAGEESYRLKEAPGSDLTQGRCAICHSLEYIPANAPAMDRGGWQKEIQKMRDKLGAPVSDAEAQQILDYLAANYAGKT